MPLLLADILYNQQGVEEDLCNATLTSYIEENGDGFPLNIGNYLYFYFNPLKYIISEFNLPLASIEVDKS